MPAVRKRVRASDTPRVSMVVHPDDWTRFSARDRRYMVRQIKRRGGKVYQNSYCPQGHFYAFRDTTDDPISFTPNLFPESSGQGGTAWRLTAAPSLWTKS